MKIFIKYLFWYVITILFVTNNVVAQTDKQIGNKEVDGLYLTITDFKMQKLTRLTDNLHKGDKIKLKQFFISPQIVSVEQNEKTVYNKDSIFAIHLSNDKNYIFIDRTPYFIADTSFLYIYTYNTFKVEYISSGRNRIEKRIPITYYYFSTNKSKTVYKLTLDNLLKYSNINTDILKTIFDKFSTDEMLTQINSKTGRFTLNEIILNF